MENNAKKPSLLFVDDEAAILKSLGRFTRRFDWHCEFAESGEEALALLEKQKFDVVVSDMRMPHMSGAALLQKCREQDPEMIRILLTGYSDIEALQEAINEAKIYNYIAKPWDDELLAELLEGALRNREIVRENQKLQRITKEQNSLLTELNESLENKIDQRTKELQQALGTIESHNLKLEENFNNMVAVLSSLIEHKERKMNGHSRDVAELCTGIAGHMQLKAQEVEELRIAAMLHDIGMLGLSDAVQQKPTNWLNEKELREYHTHPVIAETTLAGVGNMDAIAEIVRMHHEKLDGSGFPDGLSGQQIPIGARILAAASDYHDLLHSHLDDHISGCEAALAYLKENAGKLYDQNVVAALESILSTTDHLTAGSTIITCAELTPDMQLAADLVSDSGLLLLGKGSTPSIKTIERLKNYERETNTRLKVVIKVLQDITLEELPENQRSTA